MNFEKITREHNGKTIACLEWRRSPGGTYELHLDVERRFQRRGLGRSMVEELQVLALEEGGMSLYSYSAADNDKAYGFFFGMDFRPYHIEGFYGEGRHAFLWVKTIGVPR